MSFVLEASVIRFHSLALRPGSSSRCIRSHIFPGGSADRISVRLQTNRVFQRNRQSLRKSKLARQSRQGVAWDRRRSSDLFRRWRFLPSWFSRLRNNFNILVPARPRRDRVARRGPDLPQIRDVEGHEGLHQGQERKGLPDCRIQIKIGQVHPSRTRPLPLARRVLFFNDFCYIFLV